jgi:hypothetical protein
MRDEIRRNVGELGGGGLSPPAHHLPLSFRRLLRRWPLTLMAVLCYMVSIERVGPNAGFGGIDKDAMARLHRLTWRIVSMALSLAKSSRRCVRVAGREDGVPGWKSWGSHRITLGGRSMVSDTYNTIILNNVVGR